MSEFLSFFSPFFFFCLLCFQQSFVSFMIACGFRVRYVVALQPINFRDFSENSFFGNFIATDKQIDQMRKENSEENAKKKRKKKIPENQSKKIFFYR